MSPTIFIADDHPLFREALKLAISQPARSKNGWPKAGNTSSPTYPAMYCRPSCFAVPAAL